MAIVENKLGKRSVIFWCLTLSCLGLSLFMLGRILYSYYQVYFGRGMEVLSERMGSDKYKEFLAEYVGLDMFALTIAPFIVLALSMIFMMRKKYSLGNIYLAGFLICTAIALVVALAKYDGGVLPPITVAETLPVIIFLSIISGLFYYSTKYQRQLNL